MTMAKPDPEFLLYPLLNSDDPLCSTCQEPMELLTYEARGKAPKPDFVTFGCSRCGRSERFLVEAPGLRIR
jgi:RNase P subunit RPR2